jgi:hydrogenase assembly chaperone HypC/HupF
MCIGTPLQVIELDGSHAWCAADGVRERLDMMLVGALPAGTWVLAFHGAARQVLSDVEADRSRAGRRALAAVLAGADGIDEFFADLVGRDPTLPEHLRKARP